MALTTVIRKGLLGKEDVRWYTSASPTYYRGTSTGGATNIHSVGATHVPIVTAAASVQFSANNVNRAINELGGRSRAASQRFLLTSASLSSCSATINNHSSCAATERISTPFFYRMNKPTLSYALYGATYVVSCPASTTAPSEVFINWKIYKNTGTILCDLSRTRTPAQATVGGMDRGPATATKAFYMYGVPSLNPTATRQWDLMCSATHNAMTAAATYPQWTELGPVVTGTPISLQKFTQSGDIFSVAGKIADRRFVNVTPPVSPIATYRNAFSSIIPTGSVGVDLVLETFVNSGVSNVGGDAYLQHGDDLTGAGATARFAVHGYFPSYAFGAAVSFGGYNSFPCTVKPNGKYIGYRFNVSAANATRAGYGIYVTGYRHGRGNYK